MNITDKIKNLSPEVRQDIQGCLEVGMVGTAAAGVTLFVLGALAFLRLEGVRHSLRLDPDSVKLLTSQKRLLHFTSGFMLGGLGFCLPIVPLALGDVYLDSLNNKNKI